MTEEEYRHAHIWYAVTNSEAERDAVLKIKAIADDLGGNSLVFRMKEYEYDALEEHANETLPGYLEEEVDDSQRTPQPSE